MEPIEKIERLSEERVRNFDGFTAYLIYTTAHEWLRKPLVAHWQTYSQFSGKHLLMIVADVPSTEPSEEPTYMHMMVTSAGFTAGATDRLNDEARQLFGLRRENLPCLVFFADTCPSDVIIYKLQRTDDLYGLLSGIFDDCDKNWFPPSPGEEMSSYRRRLMTRLGPALRRRKILEHVTTVVRSPTFSSLFEAALGKIVR